MAPPDPIPNSAVKHSIADDSLGSPHVKVGHFQAPNKAKALAYSARAFCCLCPAKSTLDVIVA